MTRSSAPARVPGDLLGMVESVRVIGELDAVLQETAHALHITERLLEGVARGEDITSRLPLTLWDVRAAAQETEAARQRVRPLVRHLAATR